MCGIAGYYGQGGLEVLQKMTRSLRHRGPDDEGFFVAQACGLGQRRLSIIDLSPAGHQPMSNEDKTVWLSFNGEIYNFLELKKELKRAHVFKGSSDTEVIVHLYEEFGSAVFTKLEGMFAIALFDQKKNILFLARDRLGKKPLYYGLFHNTLIFGSEIKALLEHPECGRELDLQSLNKYLFFDYIPTPHSIFKRIFKLEPSSYLTFDGQKIEKKIYWKLNYESRINNYELGINDAIIELDKRIDYAVKSRLVSDVPLGIFLSGGLDSSTIAYYAQKNSNRKIKTFSIGFKENTFDESKYARLVAAHLGTEHYEKILSARESLDLIPQIADLLDEPMADASIIPTYLLSKFTRQNVTVALGGDGGDELFCGYDTFVAHKLALSYEKLPEFARSFIAGLVNKLPTSFSNISFDFKAKRFVSGFNVPKIHRDAVWMSSFKKSDRENLFKKEVWQEIKNTNEYENIDSYASEVKNNNFFDKLIYLYTRMYLMDDILVKVDRAGMFNSLEVRAPFLDTKVVDLANSLPINFKLRGLTTKYILKKMMQDKLPKKIVFRKKKGFGVPLARWISNELKPLILEKLSEEKIRRGGLFNCEYINKLLNDHFSGRADKRKQIWPLLVFELWREKWYS